MKKKTTNASPPSGRSLFIHPPNVEGMQGPLDADWNRTLGDQSPSSEQIDFHLLNDIFENFLEVVGLPVAVIDLQGRVLASSRWQRLCMEFHRVCEGTLGRCLESDTGLSREMAEGKDYAIYRCRNGLTDCATPIVVEGAHVANLFVGQFLLTAPDLDYFTRQQEEFGFDKKAYFKALSEVPVVSEQKLPAILKLMGGLAQQIARQSLMERRARHSYAVVEQQVAERTRQLAESHAQLRKTATLLETRLRLVSLSAGQTLHELLVATLDEVCAITASEVGFYHFLLPDETTLSLQAWSTRTSREFCHAAAELQHYDVELAGIWADCVRQRQSIIYNDYASAPNRKGLPDGHAPVRRLMSVPIFRNSRITAIIGVGNKPEPYDADDLAATETLADLAWDLTERKRAEETLAKWTELVRHRYQSLRALNDVAALPPGRTDHQLSEALVLGAEYLGLPVAIISKVEGDTYTILHHFAPDAAELFDGQVFMLGNTYCSLTLAALDVVAIAHMAKSPHASHPCYEQLRLEAYIAAPIMVAGKCFGTVNFSSPEPYGREFDQGDLEFIRLLARWIGSVLERNLIETEIVVAKETAEHRAEELANSNADLEQFAYVASHDLRQPLRMVNSYLALIERRYADKLDDDGREFIGFARDGALQMDRLILDLLEYSRIGRHGQPPERMNLAEIAAEARHNLEVLIDETAGVVTIEQAPAMVVGNRTEMVRLFQNLIGNAIKYRKPGRPPRVEVGWHQDGGEWVVSIKDNGIGIAPEFHADIFKIFRRLHSSGDYEGTGIGLAVCQKIVKKHGGRIWVESQLSHGSTFFFTLGPTRAA